MAAKQQRLDKTDSLVEKVGMVWGSFLPAAAALDTHPREMKILPQGVNLKFFRMPVRLYASGQS